MLVCYAGSEGKCQSDKPKKEGKLDREKKKRVSKGSEP